MKYSYFVNVKDRSCLPLSVAELLERLKSQQLKEIEYKIIAAIAAGDETTAQREKSKLPVIVVNQLYKLGEPRKKDAGEPTGLLMIDYDNAADKQQLEEMKGKIMDASINDPQLKDLIVAAHVSPRLHGVHIWYRWIDGCKNIRECHKKFAELIGMPDYDAGCNDSSRCSFLVPLDMFFLQNWGAMERNEGYAKIQQLNTKQNGEFSKQPERAGNEAAPYGSDGAGDNGRAGTVGTDVVETPTVKKEYPTHYNGIEYDRIFRALVLQCAPAEKVDKEGNVMEGARDNTLFKVVCLFRYLCDNKPDWILEYIPEWALALDKDSPGRVRQLVESACRRGLSFTTPRTLSAVLDSFKQEAETAKTETELQQEAEEELAKIEEAEQVYFRMPDKLPPVFQEFSDAFPFAWKPATVLALLPMLGTIMSRIRAKYLDGRVHSPSFQTVIEAKFGRGKGNISDMAKLVLEPLVEADMVGNEQINAYNALVEKANNSKELPDKPVVCVRKITGDFTVAGFEETLNTSMGLHMWCGTSEIDEVRRIWLAVSHILRKAYDNDLYGRSLQSSKAYRGERPIYFNTLLCGTTRAVNRCYQDPEDGLVSRTMFFKLMRDDGDMPVVKMHPSTRNRLALLVKRLHDRYSLDFGEDDKPRPAEEVTFDLDFVSAALRKWLKAQFKESVVQGNEARDSFRRRDAVNGFRAALVGMAIYTAMGRKIGKPEKDVLCKFAIWVAEYSLNMHLYKYGAKLNEYENTVEPPKAPTQQSVLFYLPQQFTIHDAYNAFSDRTQAAVRGMLFRLLKNGNLKMVKRGVYEKSTKD